MKSMMKIYYLLIFGFLAAMLVMWVPQIFMGLLIFAGVLAVLGLGAWFWFRHKMKKMGIDLKNKAQQDMLRQMMGGMGGGFPGMGGMGAKPGEGQPAGADLLSQLMAQMQQGGMGGPQGPGAGMGGMSGFGGMGDDPDPMRRPRPVSRPDGPVIYVKPEELDEDD